jgi:hypothetical protein
MSGLVRATAGVALAMVTVTATAIVGAQAPARALQASTPVRLLMVGTFHGDEVTARSGEVWLGLFPTADGYALRATTLKVKAVRDEILDGENERTGKEVTVGDSREPLFLVKATPRLRPRAAVPTVFAGESFFEKDSHVRLAGPDGGEYLLTVDSVQMASVEAPDPVPYSVLTLALGGVTQRLSTTPDHVTLRLLWAGDVDGDGKLDLLLDLPSNDNTSEHRLFLSTAARNGELVRQVAVFETVGC